MSLADRIKDDVSLRLIAERVVTWDKAKSRPASGSYWAPCPFHAEATPSFHVVEAGDAGGWFYCFGCGAKGSVIDFVMAREGLDAGAAIRLLAEGAGIAGEESPAAADKRRRDRARLDAEIEAERAATAARRLKVARRIWRAASPAAPGDILHFYLEARGVDLGALGGVPPSLRLHPALECRDDSGRVVHVGPAMVGFIGRREFLGVHRTWITPSGRARLASGAKVPKQWLGATGRMMGAPVRLAPAHPRILAGEGIETTLAALGICRAAGDRDWTAEAALSRDALAMEWTPEPGAAGVLILAEGSSKDPATAEAKARRTASRLRGLGLAAALRVPGGRWDRDIDFADLAEASRRARR